MFLFDQLYYYYYFLIVFIVCVPYEFHGEQVKDREQILGVCSCLLVYGA